MTAPAWIALASLCGFVLVQTGLASFWIGGLSARVRVMESRPPDDCATQLAAMTATLVAMEKRLDGMDSGIASRLSSLETRIDAAIKHNVSTPRRRAA